MSLNHKYAGIPTTETNRSQTTRSRRRLFADRPPKITATRGNPFNRGAPPLSQEGGGTDDEGEDLLLASLQQKKQTPPSFSHRTVWQLEERC